MGRILAIDYGQKRVGIAVSDPLQIIATGLTTVHSKDIFDFLENYIKTENVEAIVVGFPTDLLNRATDATGMVTGFVRKLKKLYPTLTIATIDERFTSKIAKQSMLASGLKKKARQNKALVDEISATIILQSYMNQSSNQ